LSPLRNPSTHEKQLMGIASLHPSYELPRPPHPTARS
jgi:hypothetical protein